MKLLLDRRQFIFASAATSGLLLASCNVQPGGKPAAPAAISQLATDGRSRLTLPVGWQVRDDLHEKAELQAADRQEQAFLIVLTELKADFAEDVTYRDHARMTLDILQKGAESFTIASGPTNLTINGLAAVQHEVTAVVSENRIRVTYLHTTVDGKKAFHQVMGWASASRIDEQRGTLATMIASFEDLS